MREIGNKLISFIVGFFGFTIMKVILSLCLMVLVNQNAISMDTYDTEGFLLVLVVSIYLAVKIVEAVNRVEQFKTRIILRIAIIIIGFIVGVFLGVNNSLVKNAEVSSSTNLVQ